MSRGAVAPRPVVERCQSIANESSPADLSACLRARRRQSSEIPQRGGRCESTGVIMCYYNGWSSGCVCILERSTDSVVWVLKKAFQKTWPYCRNGHHFYCPALKVLSGGERRVRHCSRQWVVVYYGLWNLEDEHTKKVLFSNIASHFITSAGARCTVQPIPPPPSIRITPAAPLKLILRHATVTRESLHIHLVKWRLDSCTSISLLLKSLSSFRIAACGGQNKKGIWEEEKKSCRRA